MALGSSLLDLSDELIAYIIQQCHYGKTLQHLARACRRLRLIAEHELYNFIVLSNNCTAARLLSSFDSRPERAKAVRQLEISQGWRELDGFENIATALRRTVNLKELAFDPQASIGANRQTGAWGNLTDHVFRMFQEALVTIPEASLTDRPLQELQSVSLHMDRPDLRHRVLDETSLCIFQHLTLQELELSHVTVLDGALKYLRPRHETPLKRLTLLECNITHQGLFAILSQPKALEKAHIGELSTCTQHDDEVDGCNHLFRSNPALVLEALKQQSYSLESILYIPASVGRVSLYPKGPLVAGGFADLPKLTSIALLGECSSFEHSVMAKSPPPNLERLIYMSRSPLRGHFQLERLPFLNDPTDCLGLPYHNIPTTWTSATLKSLDIVYPQQTGAESSYGHELVAAIWRSNIRQAGRLATAYGIRFRAFMQDRERHNPLPFLSCEADPGMHVIYSDGNLIGDYDVDDRGAFPDFDLVRAACGVEMPLGEE